MEKVKYVIYGGGFSWMNQCYRDIEKNENVLFINKQVPYSGNIIGKLYAKFCYGLKYRPHVFVLPFFRKLLFRHFSQSKFLRDATKIYFVIYDQNRLDADFAFSKYLHKKYKDKIKLIYRFTNTYERSHIQYSYGKGSDIKSYYDAIFSYNKLDCKEYGFQYYPLVYSNYNDQSFDVIYDCCFVGIAKDRLQFLHSVYLKLRSLNLKCKFYIFGVAEQDKLKEEEIDNNDIVYNKYLSYDDCIALTKKSKCVLNITQGGSSGMELRILEAIFNNKKVLTNNKFVDEELLDNSNIFIFDDADEIKKEFFNDTFIDYKKEFLTKYSPQAFLDYINDFFK